MSHLDALFLAALTACFLPAIIASIRHHASSAAIFALNLFLGWTFLGWVIALVSSLTSNVRALASPRWVSQMNSSAHSDVCGRR